MTLFTINVNHRLVGFGDDTPAVLQTLRRIEEKLMGLQDKLDAYAAQVDTFVTALGNAVDGIAADIAALKAANPAVDTTKIDASMAGLSAMVDKATALDAENPPVTP